MVSGEWPFQLRESSQLPTGLSMWVLAGPKGFEENSAQWSHSFRCWNKLQQDLHYGSPWESSQYVFRATLSTGHDTGRESVSPVWSQSIPCKVECTCCSCPGITQTALLRVTSKLRVRSSGAFTADKTFGAYLGCLVRLWADGLTSGCHCASCAAISFQLSGTWTPASPVALLCILIPHASPAHSRRLPSPIEGYSGIVPGSSFWLSGKACEQGAGLGFFCLFFWTIPNSIQGLLQAVSGDIMGGGQ